MAGVVVADGLTKYYGSSRGVEDLNFEVQPGEVFGYLGPNGAGKTTTIRTLLDFIRPTRGRASVFGMDSHADHGKIHSRVGYLPGELALYENLTGSQYLEYFAGLRGGVDDKAIHSIAERIDCDLRLRIKSLSHGNRQKVALIQAFMHSPDLLVLDEPTQGLDPIVQQEFYAMVEEAGAEGRTTFISSHVMPEIERLCDRVGIIRQGRLITVEDVGDLKARALRTIEFHFSGPVDPEGFELLPSVREIHAFGDSLRLSVAGPIDEVIKLAARHEVVNVRTQEASLEDIFLAFYGKGENGAE